jgi:hypothetical protein
LRYDVRKLGLGDVRKLGLGDVRKLGLEMFGS